MADDERRRRQLEQDDGAELRRAAGAAAKLLGGREGGATHVLGMPRAVELAFRRDGLVGRSRGGSAVLRCAPFVLEVETRHHASRKSRVALGPCAHWACAGPRRSVFLGPGSSSQQPALKRWATAQIWIWIWIWV